MRLVLSALAALFLTACASLSDQALQSLEQPGLEGTRFGLVVLTLDGRELVSINADERFLPASNTKLFTAAATFHRLGDMTQPDPRMGTSVWLEPAEGGPPNLVLVGAGDATLIDGDDCERNCLSDLADAVASSAITEFGHVIVDSSLYPYELWPPGWSHEDTATRSGAPVSALTVNSNEVRIAVTPAANAGERATIRFVDGEGILVITNDVWTVEGDTSGDDLFLERISPSGGVRVYGQIGVGAAEVQRPLAVNEPDSAAGFRFSLLLAKRGVTHDAYFDFRYRPLQHPDASAVVAPDAGIEIARLIPPPLIENVTFLMKQSQNLHAELLLRKLGLIEGDGSREAGLKIIEAMLTEVGVPRWSWDFSDGSGMSVYNRVTPGTTAALLLWTTRQPWAKAFRDTLPIGGVDGTLRRRFGGTSLEGRIFAKTGTLRGTNALSGFMLTKSGQMLVFAAFANERPSEAETAIWALDATLVAISETN
jgi:D-alanyl-D-alanine carboxypeptidase/D-alanyl-D-alanine-endopeptidase (penicillin-binding protein 4)